MVSIIDELFLSHDKVIKKLKVELREEYDVHDLDKIILEIDSLKTSGYYGRLYEAVKLWWRIVDKDGIFSNEENEKIRLELLASQNMRKFSLKNSLLDFETFKTLYSFLEYFYFMNSENKLKHKDELNIYFSGLDERIIFFQDKFDEVNDISEPTGDFFERLNNVSWENKNVDKFFDKLDAVMFHTIHSIFGDELFFGGQFSFYSIQSGFLQLLAGCSAVTCGRDTINKKDIITAYKTYFKLMKTDTTKYKARPEIIDEISESENTGNGYLVCDNCGSYYKLESGESADDFEDTCYCGGHLVYKESI
jgi:hypothetical protein